MERDVTDREREEFWGTLSAVIQHEVQECMGRWKAARFGRAYEFAKETADKVVEVMRGPDTDGRTPSPPAPEGEDDVLREAIEVIGLANDIIAGDEGATEEFGRRAVDVMDAARLRSPAPATEGEPVAWVVRHPDGSLALSTASPTKRDAVRKSRGNPVIALIVAPTDTGDSE